MIHTAYMEVFRDPMLKSKEYSSDGSRGCFGSTG